ncbi:MAG: SDR family NAD(P)-dependent oxidoreductase, partial [Chromatiaceae bacterium]|nr:SDR family NAD(P)-dependent oxidoreductase [Chromatiaceae bacterium]
VEMALAASREWFGGTSHEIEDLEIHSPLVLETGKAKVVRFLLSVDDGRFRVESRMRLTDESWTEHATGRLKGASLMKSPTPLNIQREKSLCSARLDSVAHYRCAEERGLDYGPAFRIVEEAFVGEDGVLGRLGSSSQSSSVSDKYLLYPALLDGAFQLLFDKQGPSLGPAAGVTRVPYRVGRIHWFGAGEVVYARVEVKRSHRFSNLAEILLTNAAGRPLALLKDCRFRDVPGTGMNRGPGLYHYLTRLQPLVDLATGAPEIDFEPLVREAAERLESLVPLRERDVFFHETLPLFDALVIAFAKESIQPMLAGDALTLEELVEQGRLDPGQRPYLRWLLGVLEEDGLAAQEAGRWRLIPDNDLPVSGAIWRTLAHDYPGCLPELILAGRCGRHLDAMLRDGSGAYKMLFPAKASSTRGHLYEASPSYRTGNSLVQGLVGAIARDWPGDRRLRVLQLDEGHLGLTPYLSSVLPREVTDFHLGVVDESGLGWVMGELADQQWIKVSHLGLEQPLASNSGLQPATFDLVIAPHVLHRCDRLDLALDNLQKLLAQGGTLLVLERVSGRLIDFILGADPGWWSMSLDDERPLSRLLSPAQWRALLRERGMEAVSIVADRDESDADVFVALSRKSRVVAPMPESTTLSDEIRGRTWVLLCDADGESAALSQAISGHLRAGGARAVTAVSGEGPKWLGQDSIQLNPADAAELVGLLDALSEEGVPSVGILHLLGWQRVPESRIPDPLGLQDRRCLTTVELAKAIGRTRCSGPVDLWLITAGGVPVSPFGQGQKKACEIRPSQSPLWGLGRVLMNEHPELRCRLLDLQGDDDMQVMSRRVLAELASGDVESEVISGPDGRRVLRMRSLADPGMRALADNMDGEVSRVQLGFSTPGLLRNLRWERIPLCLPAKGEVQIKVHATGLNFRDVMYSMGLLPDEALEDGFAGATLGLEAAGDVVAVGPGVSELRVGDPVVCFASAGFGSHLTTPTTTVTRKPLSWTYEEAATVPAVFFTVHYGLIHLARLRSGERLLIHGAAGGVGIAAIQYARHLGAEIYASAGTDEKRDFVRLLGADHVLDSRSLAFADEIMALTDGEGVDVVLNSLAGEAMRRGLSVLGPFGRFLELGKRDFYENSRIGLRPFRNNISYFGVDADQVIQGQPELAGRLFREMMKLFEDGILSPLPHRVFPADRVAEAFRAMQQSRHIGKLVVSMDGVERLAEWVESEIGLLRLEADATYLVTGGLSGFGLATARWLVEKGARHLALLGRRGADTPGVADAVAQLEEAGAKVQVLRADVTNGAQLDTLLKQLGSTFPEVRGIIHAAMVLDDGLLHNLDRERLRRVLAPKLLGAWNLHRLTADLPLDFFVMYSSATTFIGNPGQGNYVAANSYLESLAHYRRALGLPALFVAWGAIDDVGYLARNQEVKESLQARLGGGAVLDSRRALDVLERLLLAGDTGCAVIDLDWRSLKRVMPTIGTPKYSEIEDIYADQGSDEDGDDIRLVLTSLTPAQARAWVSDRLVAEVAKILRLPPENIEKEVSIFDLGMDSLMGVELGRAVEQRFGVKLPMMVISEGGATLNRITERILVALEGGRDVDGAEERLADFKALSAQHGEQIDEMRSKELVETLDVTPERA